MKFLLLFTFLISSILLMGQKNFTDSNGKKQGAWGKKYPGTSVYIYKGSFKNDKPIGTFVYYYKSSKKKAVIKHDVGSNRSVAFFYHENGRVMSNGIYRNMKKDSVWTHFTTLNQLSIVETYKNGKLNGKRQVYYLPEKLSVKNQIPSRVEFYKNDVLDGEFKEYFQNLKIKTSGVYVDGKKEGLWTEYHETGKKMSIIRYKAGQRHGWAESFDSTGVSEGKNYFYYGNVLTGDRLKRKMTEMKEKGISPNG